MAVLSKEYKTMLLKMTPNDITADFIDKYLADKVSRNGSSVKVIPSRIKPSDTIVLEANEYFNTTKVTTNVGLFIYNKFLIEESFSKVIGYHNVTITDKVQHGIESKLSDALLNDRITVESFVDYLNRLQWLSKQFNNVFSGTFTMKTIKPLPEVIKLKKKLMKDNAAAIANGDISVIHKVETELVNKAQSELENDPGMDLYKSGARGSFDNNYKNNSIIRGPVRNPATHKWEFVESSYIEGIKKEEMPVMGNIVIGGAYPKAIGTATSGYFGKQVNAAFQSEVLDAPGSDCGTTNYLTIVIDPKNKSDFLYRYILHGGKLVLLDQSNINKYLGIKVKMRSPMYCVSDKLCSKCAGEMYYKLGLRNIGLTASRSAGTMLNLNMKKFHNLTVKMNKIDINNISIK